MTITISSSFGEGGSGLTPGDSAGSPTVSSALRAAVDDLTNLRTELVKAGALYTDLVAVRTELLKAGKLFTDLTAIKTQLTKLNKSHTDLAALRAAVVAITAKLDLDGGVTSTTFASVCDPAALQVTLDLSTVSLQTTADPTIGALSTAANPNPSALTLAKG